jgi:fused signal recognition particle receptor
LIGRLGRGFARLRDGLKKSRDALGDGVRGAIGKRTAVDEELWEEIEELLIVSDVGPGTAMDIVSDLRAESRKWSGLAEEELLGALHRAIASRVGAGQDVDAFPRSPLEDSPAVVLLVGVNGTGKTTTAAKLAHRFLSEEKRVVLAAADTFRAAAAEQLQVWGERTGVPVIRGEDGGDAASVAFDALQSAIAKKADVLIVDTAGRLHTKSHLMEELVKIRRVLGRALDGAPQEVLLVLDGTTGQNAVAQARIFSETLGITGVILTKLDGTARGGVVLAVHAELGVPIRFVGVGEDMEDLQVFDPAAFAEALAPSPEKNHRE